MDNKIAIIVSFFIIYVVWGVTYLFTAFAIQQLPPFGISAIRFTTASLFAFLIYKLLGQKHEPTNKLELKNAAFAGVLFLGLGTVGAVWALKYIESGLVALIIAGEPLVVVLLQWLFFRQVPKYQTLFGILISIIGMCLLLTQKIHFHSADEYFGILLILGSMISWGLGSIFVSKAKFPKGIFYNASIQMFVGGIFCLLMSMLIGEVYPKFSDITLRTILSMCVLIVFGSILAFTAFNYLLQHVPTEKVVTNTYVNPIIALFVGAAFNNEHLSVQSLIAASVILIGVFIINTTKNRLVKRKV